MAAPATMVGTAARCNQGNGPGAVMTTPGLDVPGNINRFAIGPGQQIEIRNEGTRGSLTDRTLTRPKRDAIDVMQLFHVSTCQSGNELFQGHFPLSIDNDVGTS